MDKKSRIFKQRIIDLGTRQEKRTGHIKKERVLKKCLSMQIESIKLTRFYRVCDQNNVCITQIRGKRSINKYAD